jgi:transglutaminase-like putative cysteine protease
VSVRTYRVVHRTAYEYDDDVVESHGHAHLLPRDEAGQHVVSTTVAIDPQPGDLHEHRDYYGNRTTYFRVAIPHRALTVTSDSVVAVDRTAPVWAALDVASVPADPTAVVAALDDDELQARELALPSPFVPMLADVSSYAAVSLVPGAPLGAALAELLDRVHTDFAYAPGSTAVTTPLAQVVRTRAGVCQDFAHLVLGCLRSAGLAASYVSGYLETAPPPGRPRLTGVDASHAWVSVRVPSVGWVDLDPTNNQPADERYVAVARGRDYGDVPPLKGIIFTESTRSTMRVSVDVRPLTTSSVA